MNVDMLQGLTQARAAFAQAASCSARRPTELPAKAAGLGLARPVMQPFGE